jgi:hypothetical protein
VSDADFRAILSAIPSYLVAAGALLAGVMAILNYRQTRESTAMAKVAATEAAKASKLTVQGNASIDELGLRVDGRLSALIAANRATADARVEAAGAQGHIEGVAAEQARILPEPPATKP